VVRLIEIDVVGLQAPQRILDCLQDVGPGESFLPGTHLHSDFGRDHHFRSVAALLEPLPDDRLGFAALIPGAQREYVSAVSMKLKPAPTKASSSLNDVDSSTVQPKILPPNASGETCKVEFPSFRVSTLPPRRMSEEQQRSSSIPQGHRTDRHRHETS
jgi:hypothetical protein